MDTERRENPTESLMRIPLRITESGEILPTGIELWILFLPTDTEFLTVVLTTTESSKEVHRKSTELPIRILKLIELMTTLKTTDSLKEVLLTDTEL